eukprot:CAMPEP_0198728126 /NCGR_PEP_ID=MMETSP1475-20131203/7098_1 /TAXON_ID= ORGANISM="Unidentified sp., Strain CCMP1999" /NCGR_SAMPLE_ID=MMETSP1475 /ASSEMBLY_ACC=CAM_ASM_001111 /LENGTH=42 /DNA_ID= /DNA_START= /DNA_END= /DNA_ORIENTATION=
MTGSSCIAVLKDSAHLENIPLSADITAQNDRADPSANFDLPG